MLDFEKLDIRGDFPQACKPTYKLRIDFGEPMGIKQSSAQVAANYTKENLHGTLVLCVVNFAPRQIGPFISEMLTLAVPQSDNSIVLIQPERNVPLGSKLF